MTWTTLCALLLASACGTPSTAFDAGPADAGAPDAVAAFRQWLAPQVAPLLDPNGATGKATGVVVAVSAPGLRAVSGFGATRVGGPAPAADTLFEIGSLTKVYTGVLLGLAVEDGSLALTDTIDASFPGGAPRYGGQSITLLHLATHSSGLPYYPDNTHGTPGNPAAGYSRADLAAFMATYALPVAPGARVLYSNLGSGVLGGLLVEKAGAASYDALVQARLAGPLGLVDTVVTPSAAQQLRLAQGHRQGTTAPALDIGEALSGGGALRSTGDEVLRFLEAALGTGTGTPALAAAWSRALQPQRVIGPAMPGTTMGLQVALETGSGATRYTKEGGTPGFSSYFMFTTTPPRAAVVLANGSGVAVESLKALAEAVLDRALAP